MVVPALAVVATAAGARADDELFLERRWRALPGATNAQNSRLGLDLRNRTAYTFFSTADGLTVRGWDLDDLRPSTQPVTVPGVPQIKASTPIAVDERHATAFLAPEAGPTQSPAVHVYGTRGRRMTLLGQPATRFPGGYNVLGMTVDAARDRLLVLGAPGAGTVVKTAGAGVGGVLLDTWRLTDLARGVVASDTVQPLRVPAACGQVITTTFAAAILPSPDGRRVYFGCLSNRGLVTPLGPNVGDVSGVAELDLAAAATGAPTALRIRPTSGDFGQGDSFALPTVGRFVLSAGSAVTTTVKVFDAVHGYYVGNVGLSDGIAASGFNPRTGRGYYVNGSGLGIYDAAVTPVPQGSIYEDFTTDLGILQRGIDVDPKTRRVFVVTADDVVNGVDPYVVVFRDGTPTQGDDDRVDLSSLDVAEQPGLYEASWSADGAALGAEFRMVGGPNNLLFNATHFDSRGILTRPGTRWMQYGAARGVRLTRDEASAEVVTSRYDNASSADANGAQLAAPVVCADFGFSGGEVTGHDAAVHCDTAKARAGGRAIAQPARVLASVTGHPEAVPAGVTVKVADSSVDAARDADGTLVSTVRAEAEGIDLAGAVQIGRVVAKATVRAHGRPGTATTSYERSVTGLVVNGVKVCDTDCPLPLVKQAVDQAFGGRVVVDFPKPDAYAAPDGSAARVTDNRYRHVERVTFDDVPDDMTVAPAMEVTVYLDGTASSRMIVGLASVSAQERYRIYEVGSEPPPPPRGTAPPTPLPTLPGDPTGPVTGDGGTTVTRTDDGGERPLVAAPQTPGDLVQRLRDGLKVVMRSPGQLAGVAALWALLALPTYLAARRRLLLDLPFLRRSLEESS
ncbi:MAG TPA: hypothetical protein VNQ77_01970 [Frankiaceae bacterium]|nr:hypothetical protein [Frankiaceae bacterium]